jgi:hypothetical protein
MEEIMFNDLKPDDINGWVCVYETGTEYDAEMVKSYFADQDIHSQILSKRDSAYNMNIGQMSMVYVYVPGELEEKALKALDDWKNGTMDINDDPETGV